MTPKGIRRWAARAAAVGLSLYLAIGAFADHRSYLMLLGGLAIAQLFVWLGGEIERNREHAG